MDGFCVALDAGAGNSRIACLSSADGATAGGAGKSSTDEVFGSNGGVSGGPDGGDQQMAHGGELGRGGVEVRDERAVLYERAVWSAVPAVDHWRRRDQACGGDDAKSEASRGGDRKCGGQDIGHCIATDAGDDGVVLAARIITRGVAGARAEIVGNSRVVRGGGAGCVDRCVEAVAERPEREVAAKNRASASRGSRCQAEPGTIGAWLGAGDVRAGELCSADWIVGNFVRAGSAAEGLAVCVAAGKDRGGDAHHARRNGRARSGAGFLAGAVRGAGGAGAGNRVGVGRNHRHRRADCGGHGTCVAEGREQGLVSSRGSGGGCRGGNLRCLTLTGMACSGRIPPTKLFGGESPSELRNAIRE